MPTAQLNGRRVCGRSDEAARHFAADRGVWACSVRTAAPDHADRGHHALRERVARRRWRWACPRVRRRHDLRRHVRATRLRTLAAQSVVDIENWPDIPGTSLPAGAPRRRPAAATAAAEEEEEEDDDEEEQEEEYQSESEGELSSDSEDERLANEFNAHNGN